jgi:hypothetical protein
MGLYRWWAVLTGKEDPGELTLNSNGKIPIPNKVNVISSSVVTEIQNPMDPHAVEMKTLDNSAAVY